MKRLLLVCLMMTCSVSWAKWEISSVVDDDAYYIDRSTIRRKGDVSRIWILRDIASTQEDNGDVYKSTKQLKLYNCKEETSVILSLLRTSGPMGSGEVVWSMTKKDNELIWDPIVPASVDETLWKIACGKK